jgi:hypothetical protein
MVRKIIYSVQKVTDLFQSLQLRTVRITLRNGLNEIMHMLISERNCKHSFQQRESILSALLYSLSSGSSDTLQGVDLA